MTINTAKYYMPYLIEIALKRKVAYKLVEQI